MMKVLKLAGLIVAAITLAPEGAAAGYHVYACKTPGGMPAPSDGWEQVSGSLDSVDNTCSGTGSGPHFLYAAATDNAAPGYMTGFRFQAPTGTRIGRLGFERVIVRNYGDGPTAAWGGWLGTNQPAVGGAFDSCLRDCPGKGFAPMPDADPLVDSGPLSEVTSAFIMAGCVGSGGCPQGWAFASISVRAADVELVDTQAPTLKAAAGPLTGSGPHRGIETATFEAVDQGGGLYHTLVELKAPGEADWQTIAKTLVDDNGGRCVELDHLVGTDNEFAHRVPCVLASTETVSLDTTGFSDGTYELRVLVEDAGGNLGAMLPARPFVIDNVPPPINDVAPAVSGTGRIGQTVSSTLGAWRGDNISYARQWQRCEGADDSTCSDIAGATAAGYLVTAEDVGHALRVVVSATNGEGTTAVASGRTNVVLPPPGNTIAPTIAGTPKVGYTLTADKGTWTGDNLVFAYQWQRCPGAEATCVGIAGATEATYVVARADVGHSLRAIVQATNPEGSATATTPLTPSILAPPLSAQPPKVSGTARVGQTLSGTRGDWEGDDIAYAYEWQRCNGGELSCKPIAEATATSYKLVAADEERKLRFVVTAKNDGGVVTAASGLTALVEPAGTSGGGGTTSPAGPNNGAGGSGGGAAGAPNGVNASARAVLTLSGPKQLRLRHGRGGNTTLALRDENGRAISGAQITVLQRLAVLGAPFLAVQSAITTDADGRFRFVIAPGPSRVLRFAYSPVVGGQAAVVRDLAVRVPSKSTIKTSKRKLRNGQRVAFKGRLRGGYIPKGGVVVELQARVPGKWQTFRTTRTNSVGRWRSGYRFTSTSRATTYRFRAKIRRDSGYPFDGSTSGVTTVRVTP